MSTSFLKKNRTLLIKEFKYYLAIRFGLIFALSIQFTVLTYWVYHLSGRSTLALGYVGLAEVIPVVTCALFSGHLVDQREKRGMLFKIIIGYIALAIAILYLSTPWAFAHIGHHARLYAIYIIVFLGGIIRSFLGPSSFSLLGQLVPRTQYPNATSWSSMAWQIGAVLGPLVGGGTIAIFTPDIPKAILENPLRIEELSQLKADSPGIIIAAVIVLLIEVLLLIPIALIKPKPILKQTREPALQSIAAGLRFVFKTPALLGALCLDMFSVLFGGAIALLPAIQQEFFPDDGSFFSGATAFGFLRAAPGIGALITLGILAFLPLKSKPGRKLFACVTGYGLCIIVFGLSRSFTLSMLVLILSGTLDAVSVVIRGTILQLVTPDGMRGRVASVNTMFISSAIVIGGCITLVVVGLTFWRAPQLRNFSFHTNKRDPT
jgi:MFS family permease